MEIERTVNAMPFEEAANQTWYLSVKIISPRQTLTVRFNDGKSYKYAGKRSVNIGEPVIIDYGGATSYSMGNVVDAEEGVTRKKIDILSPLFTFSTNPKKADLKVCANGMLCLNNIAEIAGYFNLGIPNQNADCFRIVDYLVDSVLEAINVVAFPKLSDADTVKAAKAFLKKERPVPTKMFGKTFANKYYGSFFDDIRYAEYAEVALTGFYPGWKEDLQKCAFLKDPVLQECEVDTTWNDRENVFYFYFENGSKELESFFAKNEEFKTFTSELVLRSALSILIRGGFVNLLEAALSTEMPIKSFYGKLKEFAQEIGSTKCYEVLVQKEK